MKFSDFNLIGIPILVIDRYHNIVFANEEANKRAKDKDADKCYKFNFGLPQPCWQYEGLKCPLREILDDGKSVSIGINEFPSEDGTEKDLIKVSRIENSNLFVEVIFDYSDGFLSKKKKRKGYLDKQAFKVEIQKLLNEGKIFYISVVNIRNLKKINQFFGIDIGDSVIAAVEDVLQDFVERYGFYYTKLTGAQFVILNPSEQEMAFTLEEKLFDALKRVNDLFHLPIKPNISMVATEITPLIVKNASEVFKIISQADRYRNDGGITFLTGEQIDEILTQLGLKSRVINSIEEILKKELIELFFQPIVSLKTGEVDHFEALIRIKKDGKYIPIGQYIDLIYELNLITEFNKQVLKRLKEYAPELVKIGKKVFINVSSVDFKNLEFRKELIEALKTFREQKLNIGIELTEQVVFEDYEFLEYLNQAFDIKFAIDDFGTGYSSLKMIIDLFSKGLISAIKLDCSLVKSFFESEGARALITSIVEFTKVFNLETIAECIETEEHAKALRDLGVTHGQGWFFYKALPLWELPKVVSQPVKF